MFGKLLSKFRKPKDMPQNSGNMDEGISRFQSKKVFELILSNMEDSPVYELTNQISIGSEIGNIVISDPSVSPKHATFSLKDDVISLLDHGSINGTFVNDTKIIPGKSVILEETDIVKIGDLEIKFKIEKINVLIEEPPKVPEVSAKQESTGVFKAAVDNKQEKTGFFKTSVDNKQEKTGVFKASSDKTGFFKQSDDKSKNAKKNKDLSISSAPSSANAIVRAFAIISDLILAYSIITILNPFDEFRLFIDSAPEEVLSIVLTDDLKLFWAQLLKDYGFIDEVIKVAKEILSEVTLFVPMFVVFTLIRFLSTLIVGVSISEFFLGVRFYGNGVWARIGGAIRVIVGAFTWPFIVFDLPSVVSRRTFKELVTGTRITVPNKFISILGIIFYLPFVIVVSVLSPLIQGFEPPEPIMITDVVEKRVKVTPPEQVAEGEIVNLSTQKSKMLRLEFSYNPDELTIFPSFSFYGNENHFSVSNKVIFYQRDLKRHVELELLKNFNMKELLGIALKGNFFLFEKYPHIYNFAFESTGNSKFKKKLDAKDHQAFANEFIQLTKTAFSLNIDNVFEIMENETPLVRSLLEFKASFLSLLEYKDFDQISFIKFGNAYFMKVSYSKNKPFDLILPLIAGDGKLLKITFDKKENLNAVSSKFYKFNLNKSDWVSEVHSNSDDEYLSTFQVFDLLTSDLVKSVRTPSLSQKIYGYFYDKSSEIIKRADPLEMNLWKTETSNFYKILLNIPLSKEEGDVTKTEESEAIEDSLSKLIKNLKDVSNALDNNDLDYFNVNETATI